MRNILEGNRIKLGAALLGAGVALGGTPMISEADGALVRAHCTDKAKPIALQQGDTLRVTAKMVLVNGDGHLNGRQLFDDNEHTGSVGVRINGKVRANEVYADYPVSVTIEPCKIKGDAIDKAIGAAMRQMKKDHKGDPNFSVNTVFAPALKS